LNSADSRILWWGAAGRTLPRQLSGRDSLTGAWADPGESLPASLGNNHRSDAAYHRGSDRVV